MEPSIPLHTLVKLVDAEDIGYDKFRTHDLALEINDITKQLNTQTLEPSSQEQLMFTQSKDSNIKHKPAYKKYCSYWHRTNHSISACFKNQRDDEDKKMPMLDKNLHENHLYSTFVHLPTIEQNIMITDTEVEVLHVTTLKTKNYPQNRSLSRDRFHYDKSTTPPKFSRSRYDTYKRDSRSYRSPYRSSYRSPYRQNSRPRYRSRSYSRE